MTSEMALINALKAQREYEELAFKEIHPLRQSHYLQIAHVFKMAAYDIAQLNEQYKE